MLRLAMKEYRAAWKLLVVLILFNGLYLAMNARQIEFFLVTTITFSAMYVALGFVVEIKSRTETLWCSLPAGRSRLVHARYLSCYCGILLGLGTSVAVGMLVSSRLPDQRPPLPGLIYVDILFQFALIVALFLPFHFAFGPGRGFGFFAITMMTLIIGMAFLSQLVFWLVGTSNPLLDPRLWQSLGGQAVDHQFAISKTLVTFIRGVFYTITVIISLVSLRLSEQFYANRDL